MPATIEEAVRQLARLARERTDLPPAYLVGGAVRDALLGRPVSELDLATETPEAWATALAAACDTVALEVGASFPIRHLRLEGGSIDIAPIDGTLEEDLARRDFTVNALALPVTRLPSDLAHLDRSDVIDLHDGLTDLEAHRLRMVRERALIEDPIRTLRAVRFATRLNFALDLETEVAVQNHGPRLVDVAPDRVGAELVHLFALPNASAGIRTLERTSLLRVCFPELLEGHGIDQRPHHRLDVLQHALTAAEWIDVLLATAPPDDDLAAAVWRLTWEQPWPETSWGHVRNHLAAHAMTLRVATLLHDVGKPRTRTVEPDGRTRFFHHGPVGADIARARLTAWRFPAKQVERVALLLRQHLRPGQIAGAGRLPSRRALFRFHRRLGDATPDVCLLFLADTLATANPLDLLPRWPAYVAHVQRIASWRLPPAATELSRLVDGHAVMAATGLPPGPEVGRILEAIAEAAAVGEIDDEPAALDLARKLATDVVSDA